MTDTDRIPTAALLALIILQSVMLAALYAGVAPHPPAAIVLFAIAPFLGVALSVAVAALFSVLARTGRAVGSGFSPHCWRCSPLARKNISMPSLH